MSAVIKGLGVMWSVQDVTFTAGIVSGSNDQLFQSLRFSRSADKTNLKTFEGTVVGQVFSGFKRSLSLTVIPVSAVSQAGAITSANAHQLKPGTTIKVVDASSDSIGGASGVEYNLISSRQSRTVDGVATIEMELQQGDEGTSITTAVA